VVLGSMFMINSPRSLENPLHSQIPAAISSTEALL
jgi:hypothetical protein